MPHLVVGGHIYRKIIDCVSLLETYPEAGVEVGSLRLVQVHDTLYSIRVDVAAVGRLKAVVDEEYGSRKTRNGQDLRRG